MGAGTDKRFFVWLFDQGTQTVSRQSVQVGAPDAGGIPVLSGLDGGEMVIAAGADPLQEGMRVRPLDAAAGGA